MFKSSKETKGTNVAGGVPCFVRSYSWFKISTFPFVKYLDSHILYIVYPFIYFYFSNAPPPFSTRAWWGVTSCFFQHEWDTAWSPSAALHPPPARDELFVFRRWIIVRSGDSVSSFARMMSAARPSLFRCNSAAPAKLWRTVQRRISAAHHLLYAEGVFCALFAPVANQEGAVVSIRKLQLCLASLHWSCKPGQNKKGLMKENRRSSAWGQAVNATANNINNDYDTNNDRF